MRFEFHDRDHRVAALQWEGPGQVWMEFADEEARPHFARFFAEEEFYLGTTEEDGGFEIRRRDWTPWEFERACRSLGRRMGYRVTRVPNGAVEGPRSATA